MAKPPGEQPSPAIPDTRPSPAFPFDYLDEYGPPMAATSLKLPGDLKRRIERLASATNKTPHAFMVEALAREAERLELNARCADEAARSEEEAISGGKAFELAATLTI